ncbi:hypothetical protein [Dongia sp.]|uniref:hypothetical protein n=1 Tax=Dongia sp. TaxID=1977262 RepID=UPI0035B08A80
MQTPTWTWAVPLIAAILALCGVTLTIVIQARNFNRQLRATHILKISEMRQEWIKNLREAMATFQSYGVTPDMNHSDKREWYEAGTRIELLMNPADPDFDELHERMYKFLGAKDPIEKFSANPAYIAVCQRILKREWEVLKAEVQAADGK